MTGNRPKGPGNGWPEYKAMVLWRLDALERRMSSVDRKLWGVLTGVVLVCLKELVSLLR